MKVEKMKVGMKSIRTLGHEISGAGIQIDEAKQDIIRDYPTPQSCAAVTSFLGLTTFLLYHIRFYADMVEPLQELRNRDPREFKWEEQHERSFQLLKRAIGKAPLLRFPDLNKGFEIVTDASRSGVGGALFQPSYPGEDMQPNNIVQMYSRKLSVSEARYSPYKLELLGLITCLQQFHAYIYGNSRVIIHTDHKPLCHLSWAATINAPLAMWLDTILTYNFTIQHRPGKFNMLADGLSRCWMGQEDTWGVGHVKPKLTKELEVNKEIELMKVRVNGITKSTATDVEQIQMTESPDGKQQELETMGWINKKGEAESPDKDFDEDQPVPQVYKVDSIEKRKNLIDQINNMGHYGTDAIYNSIVGEGIQWTNMRTDIQERIRECDLCLRFNINKKGFHPSKALIASTPFEHVQFDIKGPMDDPHFPFLLVIVDVFSSYAILEELQSKKDTEVAKKLFNTFMNYGIPTTLQSDNAAEFTSQLQKEFDEQLGTNRRFSVPYNPRENGKVERTISTIMNSLYKQLHQKAECWTQWKSMVQMAYNIKPSSATKSSPFSLMFGRRAQNIHLDPHTLEMEVATEKIQGIEEIAQHREMWEKWQRKIVEVVHPIISDRMKVVKEDMTSKIDRKRRIIGQDYFVKGTIVMLEDKTRTAKNKPRFIGPFEIGRITAGQNYKLKNMDGEWMEPDKRVTADMLKYVRRNKDREDRDEIYNVENIIDHRAGKDGWEFLVHWEGYEKKDRSWVMQKDILDGTLVQDYLEQNQKFREDIQNQGKVPYQAKSVRQRR